MMPLTDVDMMPFKTNSISIDGDDEDDDGDKPLLSKRAANGESLRQNAKNANRPICSTCRQSFYDKSTLNRHVKTVHRKK